MLDIDLPHLLFTWLGLLGVNAVAGREVVPRRPLRILGYVCGVGSVFFYSMYRWVAVAVMNRHAPVLGRFTWEMLWLLRPLQSLWRLATAPLRVTPDVLILGEVRCGTTSLAGYLNRFPGCHTPFCPWRVGFADNKESFYLVGHYFGLVHPLFYRMVFPTVFTKWWCQLTGRPFFTFDACAQYASARWVPHILRRANPHAKFIYCVREPVSQNVSWWNFEAKNSKTFGEDLRCGYDFVPGRAPQASLKAGFEYSRSAELEALYEKSEHLRGPTLPLWAVTWPKGQSAALAPNGRYVDNIKRYQKVFGADSVEVVELKELSKDLSGTLRRVARTVPASCQPPPAVMAAWCAEPTIHANSNASRDKDSKDEAFLEDMRAYYKPYNAELERVVGRSFGWN